ncbi:hypothetical protein K9U39_02720 [Rhodoblastus acidophilus]|uniref:DUF2029 domain-containing protein n=1 Tax=Candidatus Rhodoblastus alkanivorans TaxID=2954117 RepID=A0ABS9Z646_9HYPH|nr:hypothetical protein [Candidatus Rhodoblastus alkanivorans]MCI4677707.1 hypothetical protein [Candidatus Rhodoblastus alkanivorans]MCI4682561.1 hypothetical protein [Candidatus Rhodoblastus alkanivorans]MDI4639867.1 hypothetical protein [Rhodoblastus acidophilus]
MSKYWLLWLALVFGWFNLYGPSLSSYRTPADGANVTAQQIASRLNALEFLGVLARNDFDTSRYFAYANAMLGRPYSSFFVRTPAQWRAAHGVSGQADAGAFPKVTPERPLRPWRDFVVEYPPGMVVFALAPALFTQDFSTYHLLFGLEMELLLTLSVFLAVRAVEKLSPGQGERTLLFALATTAALGALVARRYDACVSLSVGLTIFALAARWSAGAGAALAFGVVCKGAPILFAPLGALYYATTRRWGALVESFGGAAAVCLVAAVAYLFFAGEHWRDSFAYHAARPLQVESTLGALLIFLRAFDPGIVAGSVFSFGSDNIVAAYEPLLRPFAEIAPVVAIFGVFAWSWRALSACETEFERVVVLAKGVCAIIVAFSALGKVFSPQYLVWLTPVAALASLRASRAANLALFAGLVLTQLEYPYLYVFCAASLPPIFGLVALLRNLALLVWAGRLLFEAPQKQKTGEAAALRAQAA